MDHREIRLEQKLKNFAEARGLEAEETLRLLGCLVGRSGSYRLYLLGSTNEDLDFLPPLSGVKNLQLVSDSITDEGLEKLVALFPGLTQLAIDGRTLSDRSVPILGQWKKLKWIAIMTGSGRLEEETILEPISPAGIEELKRLLPNCRRRFVCF